MFHWHSSAMRECTMNLQRGGREEAVMRVKYTDGFSLVYWGKLCMCTDWRINSLVETRDGSAGLLIWKRFVFTPFQAVRYYLSSVKIGPSALAYLYWVLVNEVILTVLQFLWLTHLSHAWDMQEAVAVSTTTTASVPVWWGLAYCHVLCNTPACTGL